MKIAVEGCCHGELDKIYETLAFIEKKDNIKVDLLLICGDFQAIRNKSDFEALAVPPKYRKLNTFYKYYSGEKKAPVLTVVIGGNHEASNYMQELPYGGWVAPNIYYLGYAGVVQFGGIRIGGLSGIYKGRDYNKGHFEHPPYSDDTKRSCYHVRNLDVFRLKQLRQPVHIMMSHDWPRGIYNYGNAAQLVKRKAHFREEVESGTLGSPPAEEVLFKLKPDYWFSAHLHVKFAALVEHQMEDGNKQFTRFLSLDKCLPKRHFLQVLDVPHDASKPLQLELDREWLCVLKSTNHLLSLSKAARYMPGPGCDERWDFTVTEAELNSLEEDFGGIFKIPENFEQTTSPYHPSQDRAKAPVPQITINPQTTLMCDMLGITDPFSVFSGKQLHSNLDMSHLQANDSNDSLLDTDDEGIQNDSDFVDTTMETSVNTTLEMTLNPDEISLDDIGDEEEEEAEGDGRVNITGVSSLTESDNMEDDLLSPQPAPAGPAEGPAYSVTEEAQCSDVVLPTTAEAGMYSSSVVEPDRLSSMSVEASEQEECVSDANTSRDSESSLKRGYEDPKDDIPPQAPVEAATGEELNAPSKPKKFKRRNQSIYTSTEDS